MHKLALGGALIALLVVVLCPCRGAATDEGTWVTVAAVAPMGKQGQADTRQVALEKARRSAVAEVVGATMTFMDLYVHTRLDDGRFHALPHGEILKSEILNERTTVLAGDKAATTDFQLTLKALVKKSRAVQNPGFRIFADLNRTSFVDGDEMALYIRSTADCYLLAFVLMEDGRVLKLLPNALGNDTFLPAGKRLDFPSKKEKKQGLALQAHLAKPGATTHEAVYVLALQEPYRGLSEAIKEGVHGLYDGRTAQIGELVRHIVTIPPGQRAEALAYYQIRPNPGRSAK